LERKAETMKNPIPALLVMFALATPLTSIAQLPKPNELPTNLPGTTTVVAPPQDFDPLTASDEDLAYHGFPPRPDEAASPQAFASWSKAMSASKTRITPKLEQTSISHGLSKANANVTPPPVGSNGALSSSILAGYLNPNGASTYGSNSFYYVLSDLYVPAASQGPGVCTGGWVDGFSWIGIDGYATVDLLQAGIEYDAYCKGLASGAAYALWYQWFPGYEVLVTNLPVAPGDPYFIELWHTSPTQAYVYFVNENTLQAAEVGFTAPAGTALTGRSAEWIVESRTVTDVFWNAYAATLSGGGFDPSSATTDSIYIPGVAGPTLLGPSTFVAH
jgi:hypothetical protein